VLPQCGGCEKEAEMCHLLRKKEGYDEINYNKKENVNYDMKKMKAKNDIVKNVNIKNDDIKKWEHTNDNIKR
jgi:hypothetical protein